MILNIYVPTGNLNQHDIAPGSAIVADPQRVEDDHATCYIEGGIYQKMDFAEKLIHAAGRLVQRYPTGAIRGVPVAELLHVGLYDGARYVVQEITAPKPLEAWSGETVEAIQGERLPGGTCPAHLAARVCRGPHVRTLGCSVSGCLLYRTQAGQAVQFLKGPGTATVYEAEDPKLHQLLKALRVGEAEWKLATGHVPMAHMSVSP